MMGMIIDISDDNSEVAEILLKAGECATSTDEEGETAFIKTDSNEIKLLLLRYGARK